VKALSTDGLVGLSPVRQCRVALGLSSTLAEHAARFFENDARPSGIVRLGQSGAEANQASLKNLRESWDSKHRGVSNAHRVAIVSGEVDFVPVAMPLEDAQFLGQRELSAQEVCRIFRVPPWIVGARDGGSLTYSNVEQQSLHFVTYSLRPWLVLIEQALSADRDLFTGPAYCQFLMDALLRGDSATRADVYTKALAGGWMTVNEVRRLEDMEPLPEATTPVVVPAPTNGNGKVLIANE
jgi:HK97 family phage portal protein